MARPVPTTTDLIKTSLQSANALLRLTNNIKGAPKEIISLDKDISNSVTSLTSLEESLDNGSILDSMTGNTELEIALKVLQQQLKDFSSTLDDLVESLQDQLKPSNAPNTEYTISFLGRLTWSIAHPQISVQASSVRKSKTKLDAALSVITE